jgi:hypothetical protein
MRQLQEGEDAWFSQWQWLIDKRKSRAIRGGNKKDRFFEALKAIVSAFQFCF